MIPSLILLAFREAEGALAPEGELEKDQLGRVTLVGFVRWCRLREQRRVRAEARLRDPPPAWKQRLETWRKVRTEQKGKCKYKYNEKKNKKKKGQKKIID